MSIVDTKPFILQAALYGIFAHNSPVTGTQVLPASPNRTAMTLPSVMVVSTASELSPVVTASLAASPLPHKTLSGTFPVEFLSDFRVH